MNEERRMGAPIKPGPIVLFGSGETSPSGQKVFTELFRRLPAEPRCALLETPAGFELNSYKVIGRVGDFLRKSLQNHCPRVEIVRARVQGTAESPDDPAIAATLLSAEMIFMGPGSPSYAVRQLKDCLAWQTAVARHALGSALVLASAGAIAAGRYALPVYEIFKVGEELHWKEGLDFFGLYGMPLVLIPHWNNREGGADLDTSRCFMGLERFEKLREMLPAGVMVLGIDENTALWMDLQAASGQVLGAGGVTWIREGGERHYEAGEAFPLEACCPVSAPIAGLGVPDEVWARVREADNRTREGGDDTPGEVRRLMQERQVRRQEGDWKAADALRGKIETMGWRVEDGKEGVKLRRRG
jgi:cyanophycinase-like exopeptidase